MTPGKLCFAAFLCAMPSLAAAQPSVSVDVGVEAGADTYDTEAPGDPVESADVFYDQLSPYGVWVDEPDVGRVFVPDTPDYVPYTTGHWQNTSLGFVWVSAEPHAWATTHYGRWAYSNSYGRWYWLPDTAWGPSWVEWRQTGSHFGWAPLAPEVVVRAGWQPPPQSWHYCSAEHVLDPNVGRYYEPRERVVAIHREARPIEHYSTIGRVKVVVGPPAATLREHHVAVTRVKVEPRMIGRCAPGEARAQVERAREHHAAFEVQNQHRIDANTRIHAAHVKVVETHPQIRVEVNARVQAGGHPAEPGRVPPADHRPAGEPGRVEPGRREPAPEHAAPRPVEHAPAPQPRPVEHAPPPRPEHGREQRPPEPHMREQPAPPQHQQPAPAPPQHQQPAPAPPQHQQPAPAPPQHQQPAPAPPQHQQPAPAPRAPEHTQPPHESPRGEHRPEHNEERR